MYLLIAILGYLCGVLWLSQFLDGGSILKLVIAIIWFVSGVANTVRYIKAKNEPKEE